MTAYSSPGNVELLQRMNIGHCELIKRSQVISSIVAMRLLQYSNHLSFWEANALMFFFNSLEQCEREKLNKQGCFTKQFQLCQKCSYVYTL